jgi:hypothetical protein
MRDEPERYWPAVLAFLEETQERLRVQGT